MKNLITEHKHFSILVLVFIIAEILVSPLGNFPLNDDWSYAKAVLVFNEKAEFNFGRWPAMTLASHILWGSFFTKIFGFSHFVLRFSTIVSAYIAIVFLYKLVVRINGDKKVATFMSAAMLFNPIFFNLTNTYMTDVNFCTLTILCCYYIYRFHETGRLIYIFPVFFFSGLLVLVRQFGIIAPVCFIISCFFTKEKKWRNVMMAVLTLAAVIAIFKIYEGYLQRILPENSTYKFSNDMEVFSSVFWDKFLIAFKERYLAIALHILIYAFPIALLFLPDLVRKNRPLVAIPVCLIIFTAVCFLFQKEYFPFQNIFMNMKVGPETLYESTQGRHHAMSDSFNGFMAIIKFIGTGITLSALTLWLIFRYKGTDKPRILSPSVVFLAGYLFAYVFMLLITESYFDRYHLPVIIIFFIFLAFTLKNFRLNYYLAIVPVMAMVYVSVAGTRDYFSWNRKRWEAYYFLNKDHGIKHEDINGGFETSCWTDKNFMMSFSYLQKNKTFLIQFDEEEGFRLLKEYEFQRYFPYKKDKINIFVREQKK